ncbi:MAG: class I SAM-dependent methyltransferase [Gammaproteobacteria bacterium]
MSENTTDFGYQRVEPGRKTRLVDAVFGSVAGRYDLMNDLMSLGVHRLWKRFAVARLNLRRGEKVLDLAAGTGDLTRLAADAVGPTGRVVACDPNASMLAIGRDRSIDAGFLAEVGHVRAAGENLPFAGSAFDAVTIAFGLRNFTDKRAGLEEMCRVLRPGGRVMVLEFSHLVIPLLAKIYDRYSFSVIPWVGGRVTGDREAYQYLVESIRRHPGQQELADLMRAAGMDLVRWHNLSAGIVAVHLGWRV